MVNPEDNPHHWLQADILRIQNFIYHYFKDLTLNDQTIPQIKVISLFLRKYFRFNYQLLWSQQDQSAFTEFPDQFTLEECLPFIISEQNEHPYFHKPQLITKQTLDYIPENYNDNEFTTQESTISTYNASQTGTSTSVHTHSFRVPLEL